ncbi:MAG: type II toxin-antitoxin system HipA family toxin [Pseudomonadota bacterium]
MTDLRVIVADQPLATLSQGTGGRLRLTYDDAWRRSTHAFPLSLSLPLAEDDHRHNAIKNYLWNLLVEQPMAREELARRFGVSPANPFALVTHVGEDLAGAVQMVPVDAVERLQKREGVVPISAAKLANHLDRLQRSPGAMQIDAGSDAGYFSLAGQQPKKALCWMGGRWYEPRGRTPSTHIIKPAASWLDAPVENEHFCLRLARAAGLKSVTSQIVTVGAQRAVVVERYDRVRLIDGARARLDTRGGKVHRVHQEDFCQVFAMRPEEKYQERGGPGMRDIMRRLQGSARPEADRMAFMWACAFNYLIAGVDAHAKNFSILIGDGGIYRLAPLYDIMSALAYDHDYYCKLAMSIGGESLWRKIGPAHWRAEARACGYDDAAAVEHVRSLAAALPAHASATLAECRDSGLDTPLLANIVDALADRCGALAADFTA